VPTYEYACSTCDTTHEVQQKMTDPTLTQCPSCGQPTLRKIFSGIREAPSGAPSDASAGRWPPRWPHCPPYSP
jgi:putative FmdB family regulatory protein